MLTLVAGLTALAAGPRAGRGAVNLVWQPLSQMGTVNGIVEVGLYAVWTGSGNSNISAMDVLLTWDPTKLQLMTNVNNGPYAWFQSSFPDDSGLDGLNNTWADGNAKYSALGQFGNPAHATQAGLLVTTFRFHVSAATDGTLIQIPTALGTYSHTAVYGNAFPGENITGTLGQATVVVCDGPPTGDMNANGSTAGDDISQFVTSILVSSVSGSDICRGDFSGNGVMDVADVSGMVAALLGT